MQLSMMRLKFMYSPDDQNWSHRLYVAVALPTCFLLCFIIGPYQAADERAHYLRAVALADLNIMPVHSPPDAPKEAAGAYVDRNAAELALGETKLGTEEGRYTFREVLSAATIKPSREVQFAEHSNTSIYPPFLYLPAALAISIARALGTPVLWWLYAGRLVNACLGLWIVQYSLQRTKTADLFLFAILTTPLSLFQLSTLSADALLFPLITLFVVYLGRLIQGPTSGVTRAVLGISSFVIAAGKVAYLPIALVPPAIAAAKKRPPQEILFFGCMALVTFAAWLAWAIAVRHSIFSIRPNIEIDPTAQLHWMQAHAGASASLFAHSMASTLPELIVGATGRWLGWHDLIIPRWLTFTLPLWLIICAAFSSRRSPADFPVITICLGAALICYVTIFVLLYLQFNAVGSPTLEGVQGRYMIPLAILVLANTPRWCLNANVFRRTWLIAFTISVISGFTTIVCALDRYWIW